jgi:hypothetical protein
MLLEVSPDRFGGIQLGSIGWQKEGFNLAVQAGKVILHDTAAVPRQTIPDEQDAMADLFRQMRDKNRVLPPSLCSLRTVENKIATA